MEVTHSSPTSTHYVSTVEVEVGEDVIRLSFAPQTQSTFTFEVELESIPKTIRARVDCTTHGWSSWKKLTTDTEEGKGGGIPGFPSISTALGLIMGLLIIKLLFRSH
jgi:hypothetical protein